MRLALAQLNFTNPYYLSTGTEDSAHDIEQHLETLVRTLKGSIRIPLAVKLSPFYTALANVAASYRRGSFHRDGTNPRPQASPA